MPVRRGTQGCDQAVAMQGIRLGVHTRDAARSVDGVVGGRVCGLLPVWRPEALQGGSMNVAPFIHARKLGKVSVDKVTLSHCGGGKAMKDLIDDVFVAAFDNRSLAPLEDQARFSLA